MRRAATPPLIDLYTSLSEGGMGLIITGHSYVHPAGKHAPRQLGSHADEMIPGLEALTRPFTNETGESPCS